MGNLKVAKNAYDTRHCAQLLVDPTDIIRCGVCLLPGIPGPLGNFLRNAARSIGEKADCT